MTAHFILYVEDQARSAAFYREALRQAPTLDVPGMTEFRLAEGAVLGLMPEAGIKRLLGPALADPARGRGVPRAEIYLLAGAAGTRQQNAIAAGARELSPVQPRDWGHRVGYVLDPDGHVLAFAEKSPA